MGKVQLPPGPELVIGLVGAVGTPLDDVHDALAASLSTVGYEAEAISLIELLQRFGFERYAAAFGIAHKGKSYQAKMDAGDDFRQSLQSADALARLAVERIRQLRSAFNTEKRRETPELPIPSRAYILNSLKRPEEVQLLRDVYGDSFHLVSVYSPPGKRRNTLIARIRGSKVKINEEDATAFADFLMRRDRRDKNEAYGQKVRDAFPEGDFFFDTGAETTSNSVKRFVELLFGNEFLSPTKDETGMFFAWSARLRSADLARQVGACVMTQRGDLISVGSNEVARAGGGQYWCDDKKRTDDEEDDGRDFMSGYDESNLHRRQIYSDMVALLEERSIIDAPTAETLNSDRAFDALRDGKLMAVTEYGRSVHAEMAAITDAARRGAPIGGSVLYTSTFPCHNCAKHIVAAGINRVVYIHPYPKSEVETMYKDSIAIDAPPTSRRVGFQTFVGIAPRRYEAFFAMKKSRKDDRGNVIKWGVQNPATVVLRMESSPLLYLQAETGVEEDLEEMLLSKKQFLNTRVEPSELGAREER